MYFYKNCLTMIIALFMVHSISIGMELSPYDCRYFINLEKQLKKERQGTYCPELIEAERTLSCMLNDDKEKNWLIFNKEAQLINFMAKRRDDSCALLDACKRSDLDAIQKIADENPYVIQAYDQHIFTDDRATILHVAVLDQFSLDVIELLVGLGGVINGITGTQQLSPLHCAKTVDMAKILLKNNAQTCKKDNQRRTPLWYHVFSAHMNAPLIDCFIKKGASPFCVNGNGDSMLLYAIKKKDKQRIDFLSHYPFCLYKTNKQGESILSYARSFREIEALNVKFELTGNNTLFYMRQQGNKLIHVLSHHKEGSDFYESTVYRVAKLLLFLKNARSQTPVDGITINGGGHLFHNASLNDLGEVIGSKSLEWITNFIQLHCEKCFSQLFLNHSIERNNYLFYLLQYDKDIAFKTFKLIIQDNEFDWFDHIGNPEQCLVDSKDEQNNTLLHLAVINKNVAATTFFIKQGVDFMATNNEKLTAFDYVIQSKCKPLFFQFSSTVLNLLFKKHPNQVSKEHKKFLNNKFIVNGSQQNGNPLLFHVLFFCPQWMEHLLKRGAPVNKKNNDGFSALEMAVCADQRNAVVLLLEYGASVNNGIIEKAKTKSMKELLKKSYNDHQCCICSRYKFNTISISNDPHEPFYVCKTCCDSFFTELTPIEECA